MFVFIIIECFFIPAVFIALGFVLAIKAPKDINRTGGYRTKLSMSSQEAWDWGQKINARMMLAGGIVSLAVSFVAFMIFKDASESTARIIFAVVMVIDLMIALAFTLLTEPFLKKKLQKKNKNS